MSTVLIPSVAAIEAIGNRGDTESSVSLDEKLKELKKDTPDNPAFTPLIPQELLDKAYALEKKKGKIALDAQEISGFSAIFPTGMTQKTQALLLKSSQKKQPMPVGMVTMPLAARLTGESFSRTENHALAPSVAKKSHRGDSAKISIEKRVEVKSFVDESTSKSVSAAHLVLKNQKTDRQNSVDEIKISANAKAAINPKAAIDAMLDKKLLNETALKPSTGEGFSALTDKSLTSLEAKVAKPNDNTEQAQNAESLESKLESMLTEEKNTDKAQGARAHLSHVNLVKENLTQSGKGHEAPQEKSTFTSARNFQTSEKAETSQQNSSEYRFRTWEKHGAEKHSVNIQMKPDGAVILSTSNPLVEQRIAAHLPGDQSGQMSENHQEKNDYRDKEEQKESGRPAYEDEEE